MAKRWLEEQQERGWYAVSGFICRECVIDEALREIVDAGVVAKACDFCGTSSDDPMAADANDVMEAVADGLYCEYEDPVNQVAYDSGEGGYQMSLESTWDLAIEHEVSDNEKVLDAVAGSIEHEWVQRDPYGPSPQQALAWGWKEFREQVMHHRRFTFMVASEQGEQQRGWGEIPPEDMLAALADAIADAELVRELPAGTSLWRARPHNASESFEHATELGSTPSAYARTNRMTPAGISAFYGASTKQVAVDEVRGYAAQDAVVTAARFETSEPMTVIDLVDLPRVPSLFDSVNRHRRAAIAFLRDFAADVAKISNPDDKQHLDYVPTQIVSEYLHHHYRRGETIDGLRWRSTKNPSETSTVLFVENAACVDAVGSWSARDRVLGMDLTSVDVVPPGSGGTAS